MNFFTPLTKWKPSYPPVNMYSKSRTVHKNKYHPVVQKGLLGFQAPSSPKSPRSNSIPPALPLRQCALGHRQVPNRHGSLLTHLLSFSPCPSPASPCQTTLGPTSNHKVNVCIHEVDARFRRLLSLALSSIWYALFRLVSDPLSSKIRRCSTGLSSLIPLSPSC